MSYIIICIGIKVGINLCYITDLQNGEINMFIRNVIKSSFSNLTTGKKFTSLSSNFSQNPQRLFSSTHESSQLNVYFKSLINIGASIKKSNDVEKIAAAVRYEESTHQEILELYQSSDPAEKSRIREALKDEMKKNPSFADRSYILMRKINEPESEISPKGPSF